MSLVTVSNKCERIYQRAFDHEQAQVMRSEGMTYQAIADHFGVSATAVARVCDPRTREQLRVNHLKYAQEHYRKPCLGGCGRLVWTHAPGRTGLCATCYAQALTADDETEGELRCAKCREWKPDDDFRPEQGRKSRRGRYQQCRACETATRRANRRANPERERAYAREAKRKRREKEMANTTTFIVLRKRHDGLWEEREEVKTTSRLHAIERAADQEGTYTAVSTGQVVPVRKAVVFKVTDRGGV